MTTGEFYFSLLRCDGLSYSRFKEWLDDLDINSTLRNAMQAKVLQTGGLAQADWIILLAGLNYTNPSQYGFSYFLRKFNSCGILNMRELVLRVVYTGGAVCYLEDADGSFLMDADGSLLEDSCEIPTAQDEFIDSEFSPETFL